MSNIKLDEDMKARLKFIFNRKHPFTPDSISGIMTLTKKQIYLYNTFGDQIMGGYKAKINIYGEVNYYRTLVNLSNELKMVPTDVEENCRLAVEKIHYSQLKDDDSIYNLFPFLGYFRL